MSATLAGAGIRHMSMGPDVEPVRAVVVEVARPRRRSAERTQFDGGHVLGTNLATLYGRVGCSADELEAIAADALAMAAVLRSDGAS